MLTDQTYTERQKVARQPGTCLHCHASMVTAYRRAGNGDIWKGFEVINQQPYFEARKLVTHPVACIDCHDPETMALRAGAIRSSIITTRRPITPTGRTRSRERRC